MSTELERGASLKELSWMEAILKLSTNSAQPNIPTLSNNTDKYKFKIQLKGCVLVRELFFFF